MPFLIALSNRFNWNLNWTFHSVIHTFDSFIPFSSSFIPPFLLSSNFSFDLYSFIICYDSVFCYLSSSFPINFSSFTYSFLISFHILFLLNDCIPSFPVYFSYPQKIVLLSLFVSKSVLIKKKIPAYYSCLHFVLICQHYNERQIQRL